MTELYVTERHYHTELAYWMLNFGRVLNMDGIQLRTVEAIYFWLASHDSSKYLQLFSENGMNAKLTLKYPLPRLKHISLSAYDVPFYPSLLSTKQLEFQNCRLDAEYLQHLPALEHLLVVNTNIREDTFYDILGSDMKRFYMTTRNGSSILELSCHPVEGTCDITTWGISRKDGGWSSQETQNFDCALDTQAWLIDNNFTGPGWFS